MPDIKDLPLLPGAHYGKISENPHPDDLELPDVEDIDDDDDEMPAEIDPALIEMLGFDPRDLEEAETQDSITNEDGSISERTR